MGEQRREANNFADVEGILRTVRSVWAKPHRWPFSFDGNDREALVGYGLDEAATRELENAVADHRYRKVVHSEECQPTKVQKREYEKIARACETLSSLIDEASPAVREWLSFVPTEVSKSSRLWLEMVRRMSQEGPPDTRGPGKPAECQELDARTCAVLLKARIPRVVSSSSDWAMVIDIVRVAATGHAPQDVTHIIRKGRNGVI